MFEIGSDSWPGISKLCEEFGEVLQIIGKLMGTQGKTQHWEGAPLDTRLEDELGDALAAIQFVTDHCHLDQDAIFERRDQKLAIFEKWHNEQTQPPLS